jgi:hypothetical protein
MLVVRIYIEDLCIYVNLLHYPLGRKVQLTAAQIQDLTANWHSKQIKVQQQRLETQLQQRLHHEHLQQLESPQQQQLHRQQQQFSSQNLSQLPLQQLAQLKQLGQQPSQLLHRLQQEKEQVDRQGQHLEGRQLQLQGLPLLGGQQLQGLPLLGGPQLQGRPLLAGQQLQGRPLLAGQQLQDLPQLAGQQLHVGQLQLKEQQLHRHQQLLGKLSITDSPGLQRQNNLQVIRLTVDWKRKFIVS